MSNSERPHEVVMAEGMLITSPRHQQGRRAHFVQSATLWADTCGNFNFSFLFLDDWSILCDLWWVSTWFSRFFFSHRDRDQQSLPFCKNGAYGFGVPRWQTSRTWGWDSLPWMAHSAFCRTILEAFVYSMMFTETISSGMATPPPDLTWFTSANHNPPPFCGLVQEPAAHPSSVISLGGQ